MLEDKKYTRQQKVYKLAINITTFVIFVLAIAAFQPKASAASGNPLYRPNYLDRLVVFDYPTPHEMVNLCHATKSKSNPYIAISVDQHASLDFAGHADHEGDIIPAPQNGCP